MIVRSSCALHSGAESIAISLRVRSSDRATKMADMVTLVSGDGVEFDVAVAVASMSQTVRDKISEEGFKGPVRLDEVAGESLARVVVYCKYHTRCASLNAASDDGRVPAAAIEAWEERFVSVLHWPELANLLSAAQYMGVGSLRDLARRQICRCIIQMSAEELKAVFKLRGFRPDEEARIRGALIMIWGARNPE